MKIALLGQFGSGNSGNDGSLEAMVCILRDARPRASLVAVCSNPARIQQTHRIGAVGISASLQGKVLGLFNDALRGLPQKAWNVLFAVSQARRFDAIVVPGTGILDDFQDSPFGWPFVLLRWCLAAKLTGAKIAFASIGAGPIEHPLSRIFLTTAARLADYRSYRDEVSRRYMLELGFDASKDEVFPDLAFSLPCPPDRLTRHQAEPSVVGVGLMTYTGWSKFGSNGETIYQAYIDKMVRFVCWLASRGHPVRLLVGDRSDQRAIADLLERVGKASGDTIAGLVHAVECSDLTQLMEQIALTDIVVATRYHNVVCALKMQRPVISIGYAKKNDVLLGEAGLGEFCQSVESLSLDVLEQQFLAIEADKEGLRDRIGDTLKEIGTRLERQRELLLAGVFGH